MGLDMYLIKKTYVKTLGIKVTCTLDGKSIPHIQPDRVTYITEEVMYWRKANHIHDWFVKNVQEGEDDCEQYYVNADNLRELLAKCKKVIGKEAEPAELLPTQEGFFFGGTEYGERYYDQIEATIKGLEAILSDEEGLEQSDFYYQSSW